MEKGDLFSSFKINYI